MSKRRKTRRRNKMRSQETRQTLGKLLLTLLLAVLLFVRSDAPNDAPLFVPIAPPNQTQQPTASANLTVYFLDVGQADAAILVSDGHAMMIDGGNAADSRLVYSYLRNTLQISHLDAVIATHPHEDHIGGLSGALNACTAGAVYSPVTQWNTKVFQSLKKYTEQQGLTLTMPQTGMSFWLGSAQVTFLNDGQGFSDANNMSLVVRVDCGNTSFLFTGDAEWDAEHALLSSGEPLRATVLKVGHHGSETSTCYAFLREIMPQYAVISVGKNNSYGHPAESTLSRLRDADVTVFRTDERGTIICHTDGQNVTFETEK